MNLATLLTEPPPWAIITAMAAVTVLARFSGYWLLRRRALSPRAHHVLSAVPVSVLTAIVAPMVLATGVGETLAAIVTVLAAWRLPSLAAISLGMVTVVVLRHTL